MRLEVRAILITTLALALWYLTDGMRAIVTGTLAATEVDATAILENPGTVLLSDGRIIDYGRWAGFLIERGVDPALLAPLFVGVGLLGFAALALLLFSERRRSLGWTLMTAFAVFSMVRLGFFAALGGFLLVVLFLPSTRRLVFGAKIAGVGEPIVKPRAPDADAETNAAGS